MVDVATAPEFEVADHLNAKWGAIALESPPGEWVELIRVWAGSIRRVTVEWRRGSTPYVPIPGGTLELPEILERETTPSNGSNGSSPKTVVDPRISDPSKWALELATGRWRVGCDWAKKNGPVIDVRLCAWAFNEKKGALEPIKNAASAKRINLTGETANWMDGPEKGSPEWMCVMLLGALDKKDQRINETLDKIAGHYDRVGGVVDSCVSLSQQLINERGSGNMHGYMDRQSDREFMLEMMRVQMMGDGIKHAVDQLAPVARDLATAWAPKPEELDPVSKIAAELLETISDDQREKMKAAEVGELLEDLEKALKTIADSENNLELTRNVLGAILPALKKHQNAIGTLMTGQQRAGLLALVKASGIEGTN